MNEEARRHAAGGGITPLEYMLAILRDEGQTKDQRFEAAKAAAPYMHARLSTTDSTIKADVSGGFTWLPQQ